MKVGCVREIKNNEFRVGLTPDNVKAYVAAGHEVFIEKGAGIGSGFPGADYELDFFAQWQSQFFHRPHGIE